MSRARTHCINNTCPVPTQRLAQTRTGDWFFKNFVVDLHSSMRILRSKAGVSTNRPQRRQCPRTSHPGRAASVPPPSRAASAAVRMHVEHKLFQEGTDGGDRSLTPAASLPSCCRRASWRTCMACMRSSLTGHPRSPRAAALPPQQSESEKRRHRRGAHSRPLLILLFTPDLRAAHTHTQCRGAVNNKWHMERGR